jgi:uncharacterized repeat protein (TIGR01451 family)
LQVVKTASSPAFAVGVPASYTLTVTNTGSVATTATTAVVDNIPGTLTLGALPAGCAATGQQVTCTIAAPLAPNTPISFVIPVTPSAASAGTTLTNTAIVSGGGDPTCPGAANCSSTVDTPVPAGAIYGPKAMIINELAGSGGDALPWYFRKMQIGPLVGKRTWGGLIASFPAPQLMDGGLVTAPDAAIYGLKGEWEVENRGVAPDIEVEFDPSAWRAGHDPQLEKSVAWLLEELKKNPRQQYQRPPFPNYHKGEPAGSAAPNKR